jgi:hypothetical protein
LTGSEPFGGGASPRNIQVRDSDDCYLRQPAQGSDVEFILVSCVCGGD